MQGNKKMNIRKKIIQKIFFVLSMSIVWALGFMSALVQSQVG
jgi:hypothetical protein